MFNNNRVNLLLVLILTIYSSCFCQTTYNPSVRSQNNRVIIESVQLTSDETIVRMKVPKGLGGSGGWVRFSSATVIVPSNAWSIGNARKSNLSLNDMPGGGFSSDLIPLVQDAIRRIREGRQEMSDRGYLIRSLGNDELDTKYKTKYKNCPDYIYFTLHFDRLPYGCEDFYIRELESNGFEWVGIKINNPYPAVPHIADSEQSVRDMIDSQNDGIVGIYEGFDTQGYKLGVIKDNNTYQLVYLGSNEPMSWWKIGDVKATLIPSATPGFFKAKWYMANKEPNTDAYVVFNGGSMETVVSNEKSAYLKMYPNSTANSSNSSQSSEWSGTGFALKNGYIATNFHVIENATSITVKGIKGDFSNALKAEVIASDKFNDLAIIKITDSSFNGFGTLPYSVTTSTIDVGEEIFVLGYPLTSTMGDEIKLTTGVVSSKTGFQGDVSLYQISAPIQPGNSGGPLFDGKGNVVGIVSAKHTGAENVGYAIKASYLRNLMESSLSTNILPNTNSVASMSLANKVKAEKNFVFLIECSSIASSNAMGTNNSTVSPSNSKVYNHPTVTSRGDNHLQVVSVTVSSNQTVIEFTDNNMMSNGQGYYQWFSISPDAYLLVNGTKYKLKSADGIALAPNVTYFSHANETKTFRLIFPPIPSGTTSFDFIESSDSQWKLYGIKLQ